MRDSAAPLTSRNRARAPERGASDLRRICRFLPDGNDDRDHQRVLGIEGYGRRLGHSHWDQFRERPISHLTQARPFN